MGVYYKLVCDEVKESIDPGSINNLGNKAGAIANLEHPLGAVAMLTLIHRWRDPVRLISDEEDAYFDYTDITKEALKMYNFAYNTQLRFTGECKGKDTTCQ